MSSGVDPQSLQLAGTIMAEASAFDSTIPAASQVMLAGWAQQIARAGLTREELSEGVLRVYADGGDTPRNKIGAILAEGRAYRKEQRRERREAIEARAQEALPSPGWLGEPVPGAYETHGAIRVECPSCGAVAGGWCMEVESTRRMPHFVRLSAALRVRRGGRSGRVD